MTGKALPFSRKVSLRSVGDNTREDIECYIREQVSKEQFVDPRFTEMLSRFTTTVSDIDLSQPTETARGRYWFNLHLVLVTDQRYRFTDEKTLQQIFAGVFRIARHKAHLISSLSMMPDHLHIARTPSASCGSVDKITPQRHRVKAQRRVQPARRASSKCVISNNWRLFGNLEAGMQNLNGEIRRVGHSSS